MAATKNYKKRRRQKNGHIGSSFDQFLKEQGVYKEVTARARKRAISRASKQ
jgi:hypothetical protein